MHIVFSIDSVNIQSPSQNISSYKTVSFIFPGHDPSPFYGGMNLRASGPYWIYRKKGKKQDMYKVSDSWSTLSAPAAISLNVSWAGHCIWVTYGCIPMNFSKPCLNPFVFLASTASSGNDLTLQLCNNTEKYFLLFILNSLLITLFCMCPPKFLYCKKSNKSSLFSTLFINLCNCHIPLSCPFQDEEVHSI